jgi:hypothetical protein
MFTEKDNFEVKDKINFEPEIPLPRTALTCLNGLKHGGTSRTLFICGENPQDLYSLLNEQFETHQPGNTEDAHLVTDLVLARWHLQRRQRVYNKRESELYNEASQEDSPSLQAIHELGNYERYRIQAERALQRASKNVATIRKDKQNQQKWREQHALQIARFDLHKKQFDFRQQQADAKKPVVTTEGPIRFNENKDCVIFQQSTVTEHTDGSVTVVAEPSNEAVRHIIENVERHVTPPQKVLCDFTFTNGLVPPAYQWTLEGLDQENDTAASRPANGVFRTLSFARWLELAAAA